MSIFWTTQSQIDDVRRIIEQHEIKARGLQASLACYRKMNDGLGKKLQDAEKRITDLRKMRNSVVRDLTASKDKCSRLEDDLQEAERGATCSESCEKCGDSDILKRYIEPKPVYAGSCFVRNTKESMAYRCKSCGYTWRQGVDS